MSKRPENHPNTLLRTTQPRCKFIIDRSRQTSPKRTFKSLSNIDFVFAGALHAAPLHRTFTNDDFVLVAASHVALLNRTLTNDDDYFILVAAPHVVVGGQFDAELGEGVEDAGFGRRLDGGAAPQPQHPAAEIPIRLLFRLALGIAQICCLRQNRPARRRRRPGRTAVEDV